MSENKSFFGRIKDSISGKISSIKNWYSSSKLKKMASWCYKHKMAIFAGLLLSGSLLIFTATPIALVMLGGLGAAFTVQILSTLIPAGFSMGVGSAVITVMTLIKELKDEREKNKKDKTIAQEKNNVIEMKNTMLEADLSIYKSEIALLLKNASSRGEIDHNRLPIEFLPIGLDESANASLIRNTIQENEEEPNMAGLAITNTENQQNYINEAPILRRRGVG